MAVRHGVTFLLVLFLLGMCHAYLKDGCKFETLRTCGDDYVPYFKKPRFYETAKEFHDGCKSDKDQIACTMKFVNECLKGLPQVAAVLAVTSVEEYTEDVCTVGSERYKGRQRSIQCLNSVGPKLQTCMRSAHANLERAVIKAPAKDVIGHACCRYNDAHDCVAEALTPCDSVGGKEFLLGVVEQILGASLGLVCGGYEKGSDSCNALPSLPPREASDRNIENFVELLVEIAGTIGRR